MLCASGRNTGVSRRTAAGRSMNMPQKSISTFISRMTIQPDDRFSRAQRTTPSGIWSKVSSQPTAAEAMMTSSTTPVASPASTIAL